MMFSFNWSSQLDYINKITSSDDFYDHAGDVSVLALEALESASLDAIREQVRLSLQEDHAEAIVLGCAVMTNLVQILTDEFKVPIIDGVTMGASMLEALHHNHLRTSKYRTYISD